MRMFAACAGASSGACHLCPWDLLNFGLLPDALLSPLFFLFYTVCL